MSAEIATLEKVRNAVATLRQRGIKPTASKVIELIGGGGKSRVLEHLRSLRSPIEEQEAVPPFILEIARSALADIYEAGRKAEADKTKVAAERLSTIVDEQDAQIAELDQEVGRLLSSIELLEERIRDADVLSAELRATIAGLEQANAELRQQVDDESRNSAEGLTAALARFEALVEEATSARSMTREGAKKQDS